MAAMVATVAMVERLAKAVVLVDLVAEEVPAVLVDRAGPERPVVVVATVARRVVVALTSPGEA